MANNGQKTNEAKEGKLPNLNLNIDKATLATANVKNAVAGQEKVLPKNAAVIVTITGSKLMGRIVLRKAGMNDLIPDNQQFFVKETDAANTYSDLTEVSAQFVVPNAVGTDYKLLIVNAAGDSTENGIAGFAIQ